VWNFFNHLTNAIILHDFTAISDRSAVSDQRMIYTTEYPDSYVVDMDAILYDEAGKEVHTIKIRRAFPSNINSIPLAWGDTNQIMRFDVFMEFEDWKVEPEAIYT